MRDETDIMTKYIKNRRLTSHEKAVVVQIYVKYLANKRKAHKRYPLIFTRDHLRYVVNELINDSEEKWGELEVKEDPDHDSVMVKHIESTLTKLVLKRATLIESVKMIDRFSRKECGHKKIFSVTTQEPADPEESSEEEDNTDICQRILRSSTNSKAPADPQPVDQQIITN